MISKRLITNIFISLFLVSIVGLIVFVPETVSAAPNPNDAFGFEQFDQETQLGNQDIRITIARIVSVFLSILGVIAVVIVLYGGYMYMTAAGNDEKVTRARAILTNGVIGLVIILASWSITRFIIGRLSDATGSGVVPGGAQLTQCQQLRIANDPAFFAICGNGGGGAGGAACAFNPTLCCANDNFIVTSITPRTDATNMNNTNVRAIFSRAPAAAADQILTITQDGTDITNQFNFRFIDANSRVVEGVYNGPSACAAGACVPGGAYQINVRDGIQDANGNALAEDTNCGTFPRAANFTVNTPDVIDNTAPVTQTGILINNVRQDNQPLVAGRNHTISLDTTDDSGISYVQLQVARADGTDNVVIFDGPTVERGSDAPVANPFQFRFPLFLAANTPPLTQYRVNATIVDIDGNTTNQQATFVVVGATCNNGIQDGDETGVDSGGSCPGTGACTANFQCLSGVCQAGQCLNTPIITAVDRFDGASGNFVSIRGRFFGNQPGTVEFGDDGTPDGAFDAAAVTWNQANLAQCGGIPPWQDSVIIVQVPDDAILPQGSESNIRVTRGDDNTLQDTTADNNGVQGLFQKNDTSRPGICSVQTNAGATAATPGTDVVVTGSGFGDQQGNSQVQWFRTVQSPVTNWGSNTINSRVPNNLQPGLVDVTVTVDGQTSNGVPFTVLTQNADTRPTITSVAPANITAGSYVTINGQNFGDNVGNVYLSADQNNACDPAQDPNLPGCIQAIATLPAYCGTTWRNNQIVIQVPDAGAGIAPGTTYFVTVRTAFGVVSQDQAANPLGVIAGDPQPSICSITPTSGPAPLPPNQTLRIAGVNFSNNPSVYFWSQFADVNDITTWLISTGNDVNEAEAGSIDTQITTPIPSVNDPARGFFSMSSGPIVLQNNNGQLSNAVQYQVNTCTADTAPAGFQCCTEGPDAGQLRPNNIACSGQTRDAGYVWRFSTGRIPNIPTVVEACNPNDPNNIPSPSPWNVWQTQFNARQPACNNSVIRVAFSTAMDAQSVLNNARIYTCGVGGTQEDCSNRVDVTNQFQVAFQNQALTFTPAGPAGTLAANTWYRVELTQGIQSQENIVVLGQNVQVNEPLRATRPCGNSPQGVPTAYCFVFQAGANQCGLTGAVIDPTSYTTSYLGVVQNAFFPFDANNPLNPAFPLIYQLYGRGDQACGLVNVAGRGWQWDTNNAAQATAQVRANTDVQGTATALQDTTPNTVQIQATEPGGVQGTSDLSINLGDPQVESYWPNNCTESCVNTSIGVRFNRQMLQNTYAAGFRLEQCADPTCATVAGGPINVNVIQSDSRTYRVAPAQNLDAGTWYRVSVDENIRAISRLGANTPGNPLTPFQFRFRTKTIDPVCIASSVRIVPDPFRASSIGQVTQYSALPYGSPDQCSRFGQELNPWGYGWNWGTVDQNVATVSNFQSAGQPKPFCTRLCTPAGSDVRRGATFNGAICGDGLVEEGEDCDIAAVGEVAGTSCTLNCLRPGNTNAGENAGQCGNGQLDIAQGEECDPGNQPFCNADCTLPGSGPVTDAVGVTQCGDGVVGPEEECEPGEARCSTRCLHTGSSDTSQIWCTANANTQLANNQFVRDTRQCQRASSFCGNGLVEEGEQCEIIGDAAASTQIQLFDGNAFGTPNAELASTFCNDSCLLENICGFNNLPNTVRCEAGTPGCTTQCTLAGSSLLRNPPSLCGDAVVGAGEFAQCEFAQGEFDATNILGQDPLQVVTAVGRGQAAADGSQTTQVTAATTQVRTAPGQTQPLIVNGQANYSLQCGYAEFDTAQAAPGTNINVFNTCPGNVAAAQAGNAALTNAEGVGANSCCYARASRQAEYPADGTGLGGATAPVCLNSYISVTLDGEIDKATVENNIILAQGYENNPGTVQTNFYTDQRIRGNVTTVAGRVGNAYQLDAVDEEVTVPNNAAINPNNSVSVSAWVRVRDFGPREALNTPVILAKKPTDPAASNGFYVSPYSFRIVNVDTNPAFSWEVANNATFAAGIVVQADQWNHIVGTFDGNSAVVYVNGVETGRTDNINVPLAVSTGDLGIGNFIGGGSNFRHALNGQIDEVQVFNTVLTANDVQNIFNANTAGVCDPRNRRAGCANAPAGLAGWWNGESALAIPQPGGPNNCSAVNGIDITNLVNNTTVAAGDVEVSEPGFWNRIWNGIRTFFAGLFGEETAHASLFNAPNVRVWCAGTVNPRVRVTHRFDNVRSATTTEVALILNKSLERETTYAVLLRGGSGGVKDTRGVHIRPPANSPDPVNDSYIFRTGTGLCTLNRLDVTPASQLFTTPNQAVNFTSRSISSNGQQIVPVPGYGWNYAWGPQNNQVFAIPTANTPVDQDQVSISSQNLQGQVDGFVNATIQDDITNTTGQVVTGKTKLTANFCQRPWPSRQFFPYEEGIAFGNNANTSGFRNGRFDGSALPAAIIGGRPEYFNFSMSYCADAGATTTQNDDLPFLEPFVFTDTRNLPQGTRLANDTLKRFLFFNERNDDVIGIQVFTNSVPGDPTASRLSAREWYRRRFGDPSGFQNVTIQGFDGIANETNVYVNGLNVASTGDVFNNIYHFSINENAQNDTRRVFTQLLQSLRFNINVSDFGFCSIGNGTGPGGQNHINQPSANPSIQCQTDFECLDVGGERRICANARTKLLRDWTRLQNVQQIQGALANFSRQNNNQAPTLTGGTYIPGLTNSRWPSWSQTLSPVLSAANVSLASLPVDPVNEWAVCGNNDIETCWDAENSQYQCPQVASVYEYQYRPNQNDYQVHANLEYFEIGDAAVTEFVDTNRFTTQRACQPGQNISPFAGNCGDGVVNLGGGEQCDPPGQVITNAQGGAAACPRVAGPNGRQVQQIGGGTCSATCQLNAQCTNPWTCGNGIVEVGEACDDGGLNGQFGQCNANCSGRGLACGDGQLNGDTNQNGIRDPGEAGAEFCEISANRWQVGFCRKESCRDGRFVFNVQDGAYPFGKISYVSSRQGWRVGAAVGGGGGTAFLSNNTVSVTADGGNTWNNIFNYQGNRLLRDIFFFDQNNGWMIAGGSNVQAASDAAVLSTNDGGRTWREVGLASQATTNFNENLSDIYFVDAGRGWIWNENAVFSSTDGGRTWAEQITTDSNLITNRIQGLHFLNGSLGWIVGQNGMIHRTVDGGIRWSARINSGTNVNLNDVFFIDANVGWAVGDNATILRSTDSGQTWQPQAITDPLPTQEPLVKVFFVDQSVGWAVGGGSFYYTIDGGENWRSQALPGATFDAEFFNRQTGWLSVFGRPGQSGLFSITPDPYCARTDSCTAANNTACQNGDVCTAANDATYHIDQQQSCNWDCQAYGSYCGDGILNGNYEECDDGNRNDNDTCTNQCFRRSERAAVAATPASPLCGNGVQDDGELCDNGAQNGVACTPTVYGQGCTYCAVSCDAVVTVDPAGACGNGQIDQTGTTPQGQPIYEICDTRNNGEVVAALSDASGNIVVTAGDVAEAPLTCEDRGVFSCANNCTRLNSTCTTCGIIEVCPPGSVETICNDRVDNDNDGFTDGADQIGGGANPQLAIINPMLGDAYVANPPANNWQSRTRFDILAPRFDLAPRGTTAARAQNWLGGRSGSIVSQNVPDYRTYSSAIWDTRGTSPIDTAFINTNPLCSDAYFIDVNSQGFTGWRDSLGVRINGFPSSTSIGDLFPYRVNNERTEVRNELVLSPAIQPRGLRIVVRWTRQENDSGGVFTGQLYNEAFPGNTREGRIITYTNALADPNGICSTADITNSTNNRQYWTPVQADCRGGFPIGSNSGVYVHPITPSAQASRGALSNLNTFVQAMTIYTGTGPLNNPNPALNDTYAFFVDEASVPIGLFRNSSVAVDVYTDRAGQDTNTNPGGLISGYFRPTFTFEINRAGGTTDPANAELWHVFNLVRGINGEYQLQTIGQNRNGNLQRDFIEVQCSIPGHVCPRNAAGGAAAGRQRACEAVAWQCGNFVPAQPACPASGQRTRTCTLVDTTCGNPGAVRPALTQTCVPCSAANRASCGTQDDCVNNAQGVWTGAACVDPGNVQNGGACTVDGECQAGSRCRNNFCRGCDNGNLDLCTQQQCGTVAEGQWNNGQCVPPFSVPDGQPCDTNGNNAACQSGQCTNNVCGNPLPDLRFGTVTGPTTANVGDNIAYNVQICNDGTTNITRSFILSFIINGIGNGIVTIPNLDAGAQNCRIEALNVGIAVNPGNFSLQVTVDNAAQIPEANENNNAVNRQLTVTSPPDLAFGQITLTSGGTQNTGLVFNVPITNNGNSQAAQNNLQVRIRLPDNTIQQTRNFVITPLAAGATRNQQVALTNVPFGQMTVIFTIDSANQVQEGNENNNTFESQQTIQGGPDLIVRTITQVTPGNYRAEVCNIGRDRAEPDFEVEFNGFDASGDSIADSVTLTGGIAPNACRNVTNGGFGFAVRMVVTADVTRRVQEFDETNNSTTL